MPISLPAPVFPASTYRIALDGVDFRLNWRWNDRMASWYLDLFEADGTPLRLGVRVVLDWPLWGRFRHPARPAGELLAVSLDGAAEPEAGDLGGRVRLIYYTAAEVAAQAADATTDDVIVTAA